MTLLGEARAFARYISGLSAFVREPLLPEDVPRVLERQLARREEAFLRVLERGVFARSGRSVYRSLLHHAGVELPDVVRLMRDAGLERALEQLHDAGVYVTLDEFKGRRPLVRSGLELPVRDADFDNPLLVRHYEARTGATRSAGHRIAVDLDLIGHEAAYHWLLLFANGLTERPLAVWHAVPPGSAGIKCVLYEAKLGRSADRWFTQVDVTGLKHVAFTRSTIAAARALGKRIPSPEYASADDPRPVVRWLAAMKALGLPAVISTNPSSAARACSVANEDRFDIEGTVFFLAGEPLTAAKAQLVAATGSRIVGGYAMAEVGLIGVGCPHARALDDIHFFSDKLAVVQREKHVGGARTLAAFYYTTLHPSSPKLMLNVESGDYGTVEDRSCDCVFGRLGFSRRLRDIRSYEKLTSEGNTFLGTDLITLVDETLPRRFGGRPTDYQLVEEEDGGLTKVSIVISPRVGELDEGRVVEAVLEALRADRRNRLMARVWQEGRTLRVVRREPYATPRGKIQPLHIVHETQSAGRDGR